MMRLCRHRGFSLIELLIVIGIIGLLIGLSMPALQHVRRSSQTVRCSAQLKNLGAAWELYAQDRDHAIPAAVSLPAPRGQMPAVEQEVTFMQVLKPYVNDPGIYACPGDDRDYFVTRGISYEYMPGLAIALDPANAVTLSALARQQPELLPILADAAEFHPAPTGVTPRQTLYHNGNIDWLFKVLPDVVIE